MSITIDIPKELEERLKEKAQMAGLDFTQFIERLLRREARLDNVQQVALSREEAKLLKKINLGIPPSEWERYYNLIEKRNAEKLTSAEYEELIQLSDKIEEANAERIRYLVELAQLRQTSLENLMEELGIKGAAHAKEHRLNC